MQMRDTDEREVSHETLELMRARAVEVVESGESPVAAILTLGLLRPRITLDDMFGHRLR